MIQIPLFLYSNEEKSGEMEGGIASISDSEINGEEKSDKYALRITSLRN